MKPPDPKSGITPEAPYLNRRFFMKSSLYAGTALTTAGLLRAFGEKPGPRASGRPGQSAEAFHKSRA